jgi:lipopolysaccharide assembly outer membrane protein LptD (OstA)
MRNSAACFLIATILTAMPCLHAQFGSFGDVPVEITADGNTRFEGGVAIAEDNVQIHYGEYSIYCDYAEYNPETRDVLLVGNIRVYTPKQILTGQRSLFNLETKQMRALEMSGANSPMLFHAFNFRAMSQREFRVNDATFTTDDSSKPDFHVKSRSLRIYMDDRVVFSNSTVFIGQTPIFWFPYLFANINNTGFAFLPGYDSRWGAYLLTAYSFPVIKGVDATARLEVRSKFGLSAGLDLTMLYGKNDRSYGKLRTDYEGCHHGGSPGGTGGNPHDQPLPRLVPATAFPHRRHLRHRRHQRPQRRGFPPGFLPRRIPGRPTAGQRPRGDEVG